MNKKIPFILPLFFFCTACGSFGGFIRDFVGTSASIGFSALISYSGMDQTQSGKDYRAQAENNNKPLDDEIAQLKQEMKNDPENAASYQERINELESKKQETSISTAFLDLVGISKDEQKLGQSFASGDKYDRRAATIGALQKATTKSHNKAELGTKEEEILNAIRIVLSGSEVKNYCNKEIAKAKLPEERQVALEKCKTKLTASIKEQAQITRERDAKLAQIEAAKIKEMEEKWKNGLNMSTNEAEQYVNASEEEITAWIDQNWPNDEELVKTFEEDGKIYDKVAQQLIDSITEEESKSPEITEEENKDSENAEDEDNNENEEIEEVESNEQIDETYSGNYEATGKQNAIEAIRRTQINSYKINSFELTQEQKNSLDEVAKLLSDNGDLSVTIVGHTCSMGSSYVNKLVGKKRAETAKKYLVKKGVSSSRITISTKGESEPVDSNDTSQGRQANRRIEFRVD